MFSSRPLQLSTDAIYLPTRTPGRVSKNRAENDYPGMAMSMTVNGKGKNANKVPRTPFQPASAKPQRGLKDHKTVLKSTARPLADRTPLPNRVGTILFKTPLPGHDKLSKLKYDDGQLEEESCPTPDSSQRPSSLRKHVKHPRMSGKQALETPMNRGNHWDVSEGDIVLPDTQPALQEILTEVEDDLDELEYGPPNTLDLPYEPPFDFPMPNYKEVGQKLFQLAHSTPHHDIAPPTELEIPPTQLEEQNWDLLSLSDLDSDDPFQMARAKASSPRNAGAAVAAAVKFLPSSKMDVNATRRPQSSMARIGVHSRPASRAAASTTTMVGTRTQLAATSTRSTASKIITGNRPISSTTSATRTLSTARTRPAASTARAPSAPSRPHTSLSTKSNSKATPGDTTIARSTHRSGKPLPVATVPPKEVDVVVFKDVAFDIDGELDFHFQI